LAAEQLLIAKMTISQRYLVVVVFLAWENSQLRRRLSPRPWRAKAPPLAPKTAEQEQDERLAAQLVADTRETVRFSASRVSGPSHEISRSAARPRRRA
jgi:hypothetical protein